MKRKKWISLLLVMAVGLSLFSGCGGREETASKPEEAPAAPESSDTETQEAPDAEAETDAENSEAAAADGPSWKQDTSDCTVTWFMAYDWYGKKFDEGAQDSSPLTFLLVSMYLVL